MTSTAYVDEDAFCVIEFSSYTGKNGELVVKELAICAPESNRQQCWIFQPPHITYNSIDELNETKSDVEYEWKSGYTPYDLLSSILINVTSEYSTIFAAGSKSCSFISE